MLTYASLQLHDHSNHRNYNTSCELRHRRRMSTWGARLSLFFQVQLSYSVSDSINSTDYSTKKRESLGMRHFFVTLIGILYGPLAFIP